MRALALGFCLAGCQLVLGIEEGKRAPVEPSSGGAGGSPTGPGGAAGSPPTTSVGGGGQGGAGGGSGGAGACDASWGPSALARYVADDIALTDGSFIQAWPEPSGRSLVQNITGSRPALRTNALNGHNVVAFGGSDYMGADIDNALLAEDPDLTVVAVVDDDEPPVSVAVRSVWMFDGEDGSLFRLTRGDGGNGNGMYFAFESNADDYDIGSGNMWLDDAPHVWAAMRVGGEMLLRRDGNPIAGIGNADYANVGSASGTTRVFRLGSDVVDEGWSGLIAEIVFFSGGMSLTSLQAVEDCLIEKYGI